MIPSINYTIHLKLSSRQLLFTHLLLIDKRQIDKWHCIQSKIKVEYVRIKVSLQTVSQSCNFQGLEMEVLSDTKRCSLPNLLVEWSSLTERRTARSLVSAERRVQPTTQSINP